MGSRSAENAAVADPAAAAKLSLLAASAPRQTTIMMLAVQLVDLGAFALLGGSGVVVGAFVIGLAFWLRDRARGTDGRFDSGL